MEKSQERHFFARLDLKISVQISFERSLCERLLLPLFLSFVTRPLIIIKPYTIPSWINGHFIEEGWSWLRLNE
jgi:hypothetical protein